MIAPDTETQILPESKSDLGVNDVQVLLQIRRYFHALSELDYLVSI